MMDAQVPSALPRKRRWEQFSNTAATAVFLPVPQRDPPDEMGPIPTYDAIADPADLAAKAGRALRVEVVEQYADTGSGLAE